MPRPLILRSFLFSSSVVRAVLLCSLGLLQQAQAADVFGSKDGSGFQDLGPVAADTSLGGYAMYRGGLDWKMLSHKETTNNLQLKLGSVQFVGLHDNQLLAQMAVMVNLSQARAFFTGEPCAAPRLVRINKGGGFYDNCLYIDPYAASTAYGSITRLVVAIRNSQMGSRIYDMGLFLNLDALGFPGTTVQDWTVDAVASDPAKKQLLDKLTVWAEQLQAGVDKAIGYDKPQDAFKAVPALADLFPAKAASPVASN